MAYLSRGECHQNLGEKNKQLVAINSLLSEGVHEWKRNSSRSVEVGCPRSEEVGCPRSGELDVHEVKKLDVHEAEKLSCCCGESGSKDQF